MGRRAASAEKKAEGLLIGIAAAREIGFKLVALIAIETRTDEFNHSGYAGNSGFANGGRRGQGGLDHENCLACRFLDARTQSVEKCALIIKVQFGTQKVPPTYNLPRRFLVLASLEFVFCSVERRSGRDGVSAKPAINLVNALSSPFPNHLL